MSTSSTSSGDITVSGGTQVASDALTAAHDRLATVAAAFRDLADELRPVVALTGPTDAVRLAHVAAEGIQQAASDSKRLAAELLEAARSYNKAERDANSNLMDLSTYAGWAFGAFWPVAAALGALSLPQLIVTLVPAFVAGSVAAGSPGALFGDLGSGAARKANLLRDPRMVFLLRFAVSAADDAMLGAAGLPLPMAAKLDDRGTSLFGLRGGARVVVGAGRMFGLLDDSPVRVHRTDAGVVAPPSTFAALADRVPPSVAGAPQVRVERFGGTEGAKPTYIVYVGGTVDTSPKATNEPFDISSDLSSVAGLDTASVHAVQRAMHDAGIADGDTVIPVGYSQGGIVATQLATCGRYDVPTLVTFGSPTGGVDVTSSTVDVAVEHTDDLVPALGGFARGADDGGSDRILVTRQTYDGPVPTGSPIAAHSMVEYTITAQQMDASGDPRLAAALHALPTDEAGTAGLYRGDRVQQVPAPPQVPTPAPQSSPTPSPAPTKASR
ncbi:hypothetical protein [Humibacter ginsenosidimutans]|uniref:Alpha/beta hydrolase n=1 Tax=Humibacter ginsenosidimutans TaxID=2599293 RepID=A0A5B8M7J8_9MICO|nr:hypothetical protein [Humibacter ginsenosidimutans]QDZ15420.1 hypothetical protein FPZ11_12225 [Humibacter ginsenosidimutans]